MNSALPSNPYQALTTYEYDRDQRYNGDMGAYLMGLVMINCAGRIPISII